MINPPLWSWSCLQTDRGQSPPTCLRAFWELTDLVSHPFLLDIEGMSMVFEPRFGEVVVWLFIAYNLFELLQEVSVSRTGPGRERILAY